MTHTVVEMVTEAKLIYLLGGFPGHLCQSLRNTPAWEAMRAALTARRGSLPAAAPVPWSSVNISMILAASKSH